MKAPSCLSCRESGREGLHARPASRRAGQSIISMYLSIQKENYKGWGMKTTWENPAAST
ncbi:hypothetical protein BCR39DRAFT_510862 [Naematelia encephala]|uniref:Uncharacterized protein n=1 Tax=Naematelia encephala TaxID=71784 RepID=A0A1Y2BLL8_9TREE|nr:hypothetical protein BCR39DRAFT_510862 [Naematelia encephala]